MSVSVAPVARTAGELNATAEATAFRRSSTSNAVTCWGGFGYMHDQQPASKGASDLQGAKTGVMHGA